ncbi:MAG: hypothetical protein ACKO75_01430 [Actinomycetales bacterium]
MELVELKSRWNDVLDLLEQRDRVAWLAYFDARLAQLDGDILKLQFVDAEKLSGAHDYKATRSERIKSALEAAIQEITGESLKIIED